MRAAILPDPGRNSRTQKSAGQARDGGVGIRVLAAFLLAGILFGAIVGIYVYEEPVHPDLQSFVSARYLSRSLPAAFLSAAQYLLLVLLFSTSYLGGLLTPPALLVRGYLYGCSIAVLYRCFGWQGLRASFFLQGIPALLLTPCLLVTARESIAASAALWRKHFGGGAGYDANRWGFHYILILITGICGTVYNYYLLPLLL